MNPIFNSRQLGIPYPYVPKMAINGCASTDPIHNMDDSADLWIAHTHVCKNDRLKGTICFAADAEIYRGSELSSTFWHEYAHLLVGGEEFSCPDDKMVFAENFDDLQTRAHGPKWQAVMKALNQPVPLRYYTQVELDELWLKALLRELG